MPSAEFLAAMGAYNEELVKAGITVDGGGLKPAFEAMRIAFDGPNRTVVPGPFSDTPNLVAAYRLWQAKDVNEAIAWAKKCPNPMPIPSELEIRPLHEDEDFGTEQAGQDLFAWPLFTLMTFLPAHCRAEPCQDPHGKCPSSEPQR